MTRALSTGFLLIVCTVSLVGCGSHKVAPTFGVARNPNKLDSPAEAWQPARLVRREWAANVRLFTHPSHRSRYSLITRADDARLRELANAYHFHVLRFVYVARAQAAALTIQTARPRSAFAGDVPAIEQAIDPQHGRGFTYHGFLLEARDVDGIPFIAIQHSIHDAVGHIEGQQWARSEALLPFPHG